MINPEVMLLLVMVLCGIAVSLLFDVFRAARIVFKPNFVIVALSDVTFVLLSAFMAVGCVWNLNGGVFRAYEAAGMVLGGIFYFVLASPWIMKLFLLIDKNILKFTQFIFKILLTPPQFLYKILVVPTNRYIIKKRQGSRSTHGKRIQKADN